MSDTASVELPKPIKPEMGKIIQFPVPTTPQEIHQGVVTNISDHLKKAGHQVTPDQVHPKGGEHIVLAEIEKTNPGAEVVEDLIHRVGRFADNLHRGVRGSSNVYTADDHEKGNQIAMGRMGKIVRFVKEPRKILNILRGKKAA